ncbi:hypothetical protein V7O66_00140 [Methanolobus sp. ZRKC3]
MATGAKLEQTEEYDARIKAFTTCDESSIKREDEGFYSTCGQAFIRLR